MVVARVIPDPSQREDVRVVVERDGIRLLDITPREAETMTRDRTVDVRVRKVLSHITDGRQEA